MHAIDAQIGRPHPPYDRVEVRTIAVKECAGRVHRGGDFEDLVLEQPASVRVGQHQRCDIGVELGLERPDVELVLADCPTPNRRRSRMRRPSRGWYRAPIPAQEPGCAARPAPLGRHGST